MLFEWHVEPQLDQSIFGRIIDLVRRRSSVQRFSILRLVRRRRTWQGTSRNGVPVITLLAGSLVPEFIQRAVKFGSPVLGRHGPRVGRRTSTQSISPSGLTPRIPRTDYDTCEHISFSLFSFSAFHFSAFGSVLSCQLSSASRIVSYRTCPRSEGRPHRGRTLSI